MGQDACPSRDLFIKLPTIYLHNEKVSPVQSISITLQMNRAHLSCIDEIDETIILIKTMPEPRYSTKWPIDPRKQVSWTGSKGHLVTANPLGTTLTNHFDCICRSPSVRTRVKSSASSQDILCSPNRFWTRILPLFG